MTRPLRVALMIGSLREGGAEGQLVELARGLRARGHRVRLYLLHHRGVRLGEVLREGFEVVDVGLPKLRPAWEPLGKLRALAALWRTLRDLRAFRPQVLHPWMFEADAWAWLALMLGAPGRLVTTRRIVADWHYRASWRVWLQERINARTAAVIVNARAVGTSTRRTERGLRRRRIHVVHNGMDVARVEGAPAANLRELFPALADCDTIALNVGNLLPYKGHADLLRAWRFVIGERPGAGLVIVGSDEGEGPALRTLAGELGVAHRVVFAGSRADVPALMLGADLFVLPSHLEGFSNALMEAMAAGLAIVATRTSGNPELVTHGRTGVLVPVGEPTILAAAIVALLADGGERTRLGTAASEHARKAFSLDAMVEGTLAVYDKALTGGRR